MSSSSQLPPPLTILEAFKSRHSIRCYQGENLTEAQKNLVEECISEANTLSTPFRSEGIELSSSTPGLSLLSVIKGEAGWIVEKILKRKRHQPEKNEVIDDQMKTVIDVAYIGEHVVMKLAQYSIDTIWIADTYNESEAEKRFPGFNVPSAIAFGIKQTKKNPIQRPIRFFGSLPGERLPFENIFYDSVNKRLIYQDDFESKDKKNVPKYPEYMKDFLTALRSSPSAKNIQPWRFVFTKKEVHLFCVIVNKYSLFDMGIALASLHLLEEIRGGNSSIVFLNPPPQPFPFKATYIATTVYKL